METAFFRSPIPVGGGGQYETNLSAAGLFGVLQSEFMEDKEIIDIWRYDLSMEVGRPTRLSSKSGLVEDARERKNTIKTVLSTRISSLLSCTRGKKNIP